MQSDTDFASEPGAVTTLAEGKAYALHNVIALDGRVGHYPISARGYAPCNCYLLKEPEEALLLDTGFGIHRDAMIAQIGGLLDPGTALSMTVMRLNDYLSVGNAVPIARRFGIRKLYATIQTAAGSLDFESRNAAEAETNRALMPVELITGNEWIDLGQQGRRIKFNQSPLRLINTRWIYDPLSRALFSSDMFAHSWSATPRDDWTLTARTDTTTEEDVRRFMLSTRYWWLEGARTDELRRELAGIFDSYPIETIAPGYGFILKGAEIVERHYRMLDEVLRKLDQSRTPPRYVAHNEDHYV